jgi:hypothetical protein
VYLLSAQQPHGRLKSVNDLMPIIGARFYTELENGYKYVPTPYGIMIHHHALNYILIAADKRRMTDTLAGLHPPKLTLPSPRPVTWMRWRRI